MKVLSGLFVVATVTGVAFAAPKKATHTIYGGYVQQHKVSVHDSVTNTTSPSVLTDVLVLKKGTDPKGLGFCFELYFDNNQQCSMEGEALKVDDYYTYSVRKEDLRSQTCELKIEFTPETIKIQDIGGNCKADHCGPKAAIDGAVFKRKGRSSQPVPCGETH
jgi:hypothetical protein